MDTTHPYLEVIVKKEHITLTMGMTEYGVCGHPYYRHFDTYEEMSPVGCKYCECVTFVDIWEAKNDS